MILLTRSFYSTTSRVGKLSSNPHRRSPHVLLSCELLITWPRISCILSPALTSMLNKSGVCYIEYALWILALLNNREELRTSCSAKNMQRRLVQLFSLIFVCNHVFQIETSPVLGSMRRGILADPLGPSSFKCIAVLLFCCCIIHVGIIFCNSISRCNPRRIFCIGRVWHPSWLGNPVSYRQ
jgi:hypothetical protein